MPSSRFGYPWIVCIGCCNSSTLHVAFVNVTTETVSDIVASRVREARRGRRWQVADLAARCAELGHPELSTAVIQNIEGGRRDKDGNRRRAVTVDELRVLADALGFSPADVLDGLPPGTIGGMTLDEIEALGDTLKAAVSAIRFRDTQEG